MFKTSKGYEYDTYVKDTTNEYRLSPNDVISLRLFANNGFDLIDIERESNQQIQQLNIGIEYTLEYDGQVELPIVGRVNLAGKTLKEVEFYLEELYEKDFNDVFILLRVTNRRVIVFPGNGGDGVVITLTNNNVKLLEAIALAGGLATQGRSARIKLIRGDLKDPEVYLIDLSSIEGISQADITLQANDVIYVEPLGVTTRQVLSEMSPILGFVTSLIAISILINNNN